MSVKFPSRSFALTCGLFLFSQVLVAQTTTQIFPAVDTRGSLPTASDTSPDIYGSSTLSLTCSTSPITATLSGPNVSTNPAQNLLVDNNLDVTVTLAGASASTSSTPTNVCTGQPFTTPPNVYGNCFNTTYEYQADDFVGDDPDAYVIPAGLTGAGQTVDAAGGVPPIDISSLLSAGQQSLTVSVVDEGTLLTASTINLNTNCTVNGVTGGTVPGNPITTGPSGSGLTQQFNFNTIPGNTVGFVYDVSGPNSQNELTNPITANNALTIPQVVDAGVVPGTFQSTLAPGTSFATSNCFVHNGEQLNGAAACKLYTLVCYTTTGATLDSGTPAIGANCPVSTQPNEVVQDNFDGPSFSLQNIYTPYGFFREGIGLLMASESWYGTSTDPGGPCAFDPASGLGNLPCPQNLLNNFSGPGKFGGTGETSNPNSNFISVYGVPEDFTSVIVAGELPDFWVNTESPQVYFSSQTPNFSKGADVLNSAGKLVPLPNASGYVPQPIKSITYGISPVGSVPSPANEPISTDTALNNPAAGCSQTPLTAPTEPNFAPSPVTLNFTANGQYLLHYYAQDCAGTQELQFTEAPSTGSWSTNFFTYPINVDTIPPKVSGLTLSPAGPYKPNATVTATYSCSDAGYVAPPGLNIGSGLVLCGTSLYLPETEYSTPTLSTKFSVGSSAGKKTLTIYAIDGAGNISSASATYTVN